MSPVTVEAVTDPALLAPHQERWAALAARAVEPNPFLAPWFHLPALRHLASPANGVVTLLAWHGGRERELVGLMAVAHQRRSRRLPVSCLSTWRHPYCFLTTPLLDPDHASEALAALLGWTHRRRDGRLLRLPRVNGDGPFASLLADYLAERGLAATRTGRVERPLYRHDGSAGVEAYLRQVASGDRRRRLGRYRRRLERGGPLTTTVTTDPDGITPLADAFLALEARGWKGREGTAMGQEPRAAAFFREMVAEAAGGGGLLLLTLRLAGEPVAMRISLLCGEGGIAFKSAFDEVYASDSPGLLVEVDHLRHLLAHPEIRWIDSCAASANSPVTWLWPARRPVETLLLSTGDAVGDLVIRTLPLARRVVAAARRLRS